MCSCREEFAQKGIIKKKYGQVRSPPKRSTCRPAEGRPCLRNACNAGDPRSSALVHAEQACFWQYFGQADGVPVLLQDACNVGDEGGFAPNIASNEEGLNLVNQAIEVCKNASEQSSCANHLYKPHAC